jgi:hypothetical protein
VSCPRSRPLVQGHLSRIFLVFFLVWSQNYSYLNYSGISCADHCSILSHALGAFVTNIGSSCLIYFQCLNMDADLFTADFSPIKHSDWQPPEAAVADDSSAGYFLDSIEGSLLNISNELEVESQRIHECSICEKKYKNKHHLQRHLKCHSENNNIIWINLYIRRKS